MSLRRVAAEGFTNGPGQQLVAEGGMRVHMIGICGVGMGSLAGLLHDLGHEVRGSDADVYPPMSTFLEARRIPIAPGYRAANLEPRPDLVVVGNAVRRDHPEVCAAAAAGIPRCSLPEAVDRFLLGTRRVLVVAGTHGKTTSAAMLAWVLERAGWAPGFLIGGSPANFAEPCRMGSGDAVVVEGDEYDSAFFDKRPKFVHYRPHGCLLTGVEFDHADIYPDLAAVQGAFASLVALLPPQGPLVVGVDSPATRGVLGGRPAVTFGSTAGADWRFGEVRDDGTWTRAEVRGPGGEPAGCLRLGVPGVINVRNALGVYVFGRELGIAADTLAEALAGFRGVRRRQEVVGTVGGALLVDDFAHHPTAVAGTLSALRQRHPRRRLWAVFEPRSNTSRRRIFQDEFARALAGADRVTIGPVHRAALVGEAERLSPGRLAEDLRRAGVPAEALPDGAAIAERVRAEVTPDEVVVVMSNGGFDGLVDRLRDPPGSVA